jgi:hypothetical protein
MDYGYRESRENDEQITIYRVSDQDRQTLLALASLEPQGSSDGVIQFPPEPTILQYIRSKPNLVESAASRILQVESKPLKPTARQAGYTLRQVIR